MKVSVIIPFYHGNKYMKNLAKMLALNGERLSEEDSLEIVIVNDSPTENVDLSAWQMAGIKPVVACNSKNLGIHRSRVQGLKYASGDLILFLDQDDEISDECLRTNVKFLGDNDFCVSNGYIENSNGEKRKIFKSEKHQRCCLDLSFHYCYTNPIISPGQVLIRKDAIPRQWTEHFFEHNGADDHYLWLLLLENGKSGSLNPYCVYTHISTGENTSLNLEAMMNSNLELVDALKDIAPRKYLRRLLRRSMYYASNPEKVITKIRFFDVGIQRMIYSHHIE